jgi:hypothetical protein
MPSLGFAAFDALTRAGRYTTLTLIGFTFEGWQHHPWAKERAIVQSCERDGRVALLR